MQRISASKIKNGFTLIEVLIAMVVLAVGMLGLAAITTVVFKSHGTSRHVGEATSIASDLMETLKRQDYSAIPDCTTAISPGSSCSAIMNSGIYGLGSSFYPPTTSSTCTIPDVLAGDRSFDLMTSEYVSSDVGAAQNLCTYSASLTLDGNQYIRYYRTYADTTTTADDRVLVVVVLWKYRGEWKNIHLTTTVNN